MAESVIRAASLEDVDRVLEMYEWLFAPPGSRPALWDPVRAAAAIRHGVSSEDAVVLVAAVGEELVGFCTAYDELQSVRFGRRVWVEDLAVHPERRSLGTGKRLLDAAKDWARLRGASHLELDSAETRADAHRFYDREQPSWRSVCFGWEL
jgi:GNAT superfamily N-acetyltransferase